MNTLTIDTTQPVVAGLYGAKPTTQRPEVSLELFRDPLAQPVVLPASFSVTRGVTVGLGMLANDALGDCVVAATEHARMFKALVSFANNVMTFEKGFRPPRASYTKTLYFAFEESQGEPGPRPDFGCDPGAWFVWFYKQGLCDAFGQPNWQANGEANLTIIKQAIVEFGGLFGAFNVPANMQGLFGVAPFSYEPGDAMTKDGHAMFVTGYDDATQLFEVCTWGVIWHCTYDFLRYCLEGAFVFVTKEDADNAHVNFTALESACKSLPGGEGNPTGVAPVAGGGIFHHIEHDVKSFVSEKHFEDIAAQGKKIVDMALNREAVNLVLHEIVVLLKIAIMDHVL